jgi:ADP-L-glycero-D-manno-heptose 6-epimerase
MIVVTGASGFIGSCLVAALNDSGRNDVILCDSLGEDLRWMNLRKRAFRDFVHPDDLQAYLARCGKIDCVVHLGANSSTTATNGDEVIRSNFQFSVELLSWCVSTATPLIYASSAATYGDGNCGFEEKCEFDALRQLRPLNLYGWSKHQFDLVVAERRKSALPLPPKCIGLKFFNVYGPNEYHKGSMLSVVARNFQTARSGGIVRLFKSYNSSFPDGGQKRDFVYVDDVVKVIMWSIENDVEFGIFNVGTGRASTFQSFVEALFRAVNQPPRIEFIEMPDELKERYQYFTEASLGKLRCAGYNADFKDINEGVLDYVGYLQSTDPYR